MKCDCCGLDFIDGYRVTYDIYPGRVYKDKWYESMERHVSLYICVDCKPFLERKLKDVEYFNRKEKQ